MTRLDLQLYFEGFVFRNGEHHPTEKGQQAFVRLRNANIYFSEHTELTFYQVCDMILKSQDLLYQLLPSPKDEKYDSQLSRFNEIVKWCKEEMINETK